MGQSWWWVVLAVVVVVALLVAVALLRTRGRRTDSGAMDVGIAAAAAGGTAGAVGAAAVAAVHAEKDARGGERAPDQPAADAGPDARTADRPDRAAPAPAAAEPSDLARGDRVAEPDLAAEPPGSVDPGTEINAAADSAGAAEPEIFEAEDPGAAQVPPSSALSEDRPGAAARIPAPREEQPLPESPTGPGEPRSPEPRTPDPEGSALAGLDSGLVGPATSLSAAAAAVSAASARPGPYPGSLLPAADGSSPSPDHQVKANEGSRRFHTPDSPYYLRTRGDAWFRTAEEARAAGFTAWDDHA
jgi:hypothetical protein